MTDVWYAHQVRFRKHPQSGLGWVHNSLIRKPIEKVAIVGNESISPVNSAPSHQVLSLDIVDLT